MTDSSLTESKKFSEGSATPEARRVTQKSPTVGKSIGWLIVFGLLFYGAVVIYGLIYGGYLVLTEPDRFTDRQAIEGAIRNAMISPSGIAMTFAIQAILLIPLIIWASNFAHQSWRETLAFKSVASSVLGLWFLVYVVYFVLQGIAQSFMPIEHEDIVSSLAGSSHLGLALGMVLVAPVIEELVFRGYLFKAWRHTRLGLWGTLVLTSLLFTVVHAAQYSILLLLYVFALSMLLGLARERTGSIWVPIMIHSFNNLIAVIALVYVGMV